jgi:chromosome partitioning protein
MAEMRKSMAKLTEIDKDHKCTVVVFCNYKGGCQKTTLSFGFANFLFEKNNRVLVIDTDPQGDLGKKFNISNPKKENTLTLIYRELGEVGENERLPCKVFNAPVHVRGDIKSNDKASISIIPADNFLVMTAKYAESLCRSETVLRKKFARLINAYKDYYDYIIFDTTPVIEDSICGINAISVADCQVITVDNTEAAEKIEWTVEAINRVCKKTSNILIAGTDYTVDDVALTEFFEGQRKLNGLNECSEPIRVKSKCGKSGYDERRSTLYRVLRKAFPNNMCETAIPHMQRIGNNAYTGIDKKYKNLYDCMFTEIVRNARSIYVDDLHDETVLDGKIKLFKQYLNILKHYNTKNVIHDMNKICFEDIDTEKFEE